MHTRSCAPSMRWPDTEGRIGRLLADPPGFQRAELPKLYQRIEAFFNQHLLP